MAKKPQQPKWKSTSIRYKSDVYKILTSNKNTKGVPIEQQVDMALRKFFGLNTPLIEVNND